MKKLLLLSILTLGVMSVVYSQTKFEKTIGGSGQDGGYCIIPVSTGGYVIGGYSIWHYGAPEAAQLGVLIKINDHGDTLWKTFIPALASNTQSDVIDVLELADGSFMLTGRISTVNLPSSDDLLIAKIDKNGSLKWKKNYNVRGYDKGNRIIKLEDNNFVIAGTTNDLGAQTDILIMKVNPTGDSIWRKVYGMTGLYNETGNSIFEKSNNQLLIGGGTNYGNNKSLFLTLSAQGDSLSCIFLPTTGQGKAATKILSIKGYYIYCQGNFVVKIDTSFNQLDISTKFTTGAGDGAPAANMIMDSDSNLIVTGTYTSASLMDKQLYVAKLNKDLDTLWVKHFGIISTNNVEEGFGICNTADGKYLAVGRAYQDVTNLFDIYLLKLNKDGTLADYTPTLIPEININALSGSIYPNPTKDYIFIKRSSSGEASSISIYNVQGKLLLQQISKQQTTAIDLSNFSKGIYILKLKSSGKSEVTRIVKE